MAPPYLEHLAMYEADIPETITYINNISKCDRDEG